MRARRRRIGKARRKLRRVEAKLDGKARQAFGPLARRQGRAFLTLPGSPTWAAYYDGGEAL